MGGTDRGLVVPAMGGRDRGWRADVIGRTIEGPRIFVMGDPDPFACLDTTNHSLRRSGDLLFTPLTGDQSTMSKQQRTPPTTTGGSEIGRATGFELTPSDPSTRSNIDSALERNRAFATAGGHRDAVVFPNLRLLVITCLDPRVDPAHFLGLGLSDAMVVRNVGGRVTPEVINDVAFIGLLAENILPDGPLFEVALIHHTQCGTGALANDTFRQRYAERIGAEEATLRDDAILDPAATVTGDVERLRSAAPTSPRVTVSGHVYDVVTGLVKTVAPVDR